MVKFSVFAFIFVSAFCLGEDQPECSSFSEKYRLIKLQPYEKSPSFYVRNKSHVIFFKEQKIRKYFSSTESDVISARFKSKILAHFPLKENLDLYIDSISGEFIEERSYEFMIADLLEAGDAELLPTREIWSEKEKTSIEIKLHRKKGSISSFRFFCDLKNEMVFYIMDYMS